ncbi:MAG: single-stranded-DNA-specific exonuclease RecJ [Hyphomicrobiaceae bacterium]
MAQAARRPAMTEGAGEHYLGVACSAKGQAWSSRLDTAGLNLATAIAQRHGLPDVLARVITARGATLDNVPVLLNPTLKALMPDPSRLTDMEKAAGRIAGAILAREQVAIFGDYDVDGACASALVHRFLAHHGLAPRIYIPDRLFEGYGPNPQAIRQLAEDGARLILTVDCGTTSFEALAVAREAGADVVVIDHHQADERLPDVTAVVNPNRQDDVSGEGTLCAAGVVFLALVATARALRARGHYKSAPEPPLMEWLDLVALATVCDVVPLEGLNRAYVTQGLKVMRGRRNPGLRALADAAGLNQPPNTYHLGFLLGPRINAGGRIGDSALGARLLSTDDEAETGRIAVLLDRLNKERKAMETAILEAALAASEVEVATDPDLPILIQGSKDWHKGLVGLVASRLTERFRRPSLVLAWTESGEGTGSLRSIAGVDIGSAVRAAVAEGILKKGGGHAMAAGLTVAADDLPRLKAFLADRLRGHVADARGLTTLKVDGSLTPAAVSADFIERLEEAGPFGQGNPTPRFVFPAHRLRSLRVIGEAHLRCTVEAGDGSRLDAVAFRSVGTPLGEAMTAAAAGRPIHVAGHLRRDHWNGRERIELTVDDVADPARQG